MTTAIIYSDEWRQFDYGPEHPLRMERLGLTWRLMEAYGLTALPRAKVWAPEPAELDEIARFHSREYIEILRAVSAGDWVPHAGRYGLGPGDNPIFPGLWEAAQLGAGGSLLAARLVADGEATRAFHFAGGLHHAMPGRASGFCYVNDAVLAIMRLRERGFRVAYVDIDAHHGDGVQFAFYDDPNVLTVSTLHPAGPQKTMNMVEFYYPEEIAAFERDFVQAQQAAYMETCVEDDEIAERMDAGRKALMQRGDNEIGPYQSPMEDGMQHFHEWYRHRIGAMDTSFRV